MRTKQQIDKIKSRQSPPIQVTDLLGLNELAELKKKFYSSNDIEVKETGPRVLKLKENDPIVQNIIERLYPMIGDCKVRYAAMFYVDKPHVLHIDDEKELPQAYKAITVPLDYDGDQEPGFFVFNQYYYGGPAKFFKGKKTKTKEHYNSTVTDYSAVENRDSKGIHPGIYSAMDHLDYEWLEGFSVHSYFNWRLMSAIVFDSLQIHCASDFRKQGSTYKLGLSIFTVDPDEDKEFEINN